MGELTGKLNTITFTAQGTPLVTFEVDQYSEAIKLQKNLSQDKVVIKVSKHQAKRSMDSNSYFWILVDKLAEKLNMSKEDIYRNAIKNIGGVSEIVCVKNEAVEKLRSGWAKNGLGWQTDTMPSKLQGCTNVILYYGSSTFDQKQMTRLIDNIVQDCKAVGIETMTPAELDRLLGDRK